MSKKITDKLASQLVTAKPIIAQITAAEQVGVEVYLKQATTELRKQGQKGTGPSKDFFIVKDSIRYPLKAIVRMALLNVKGDAKQRNPQPFAQAAELLLQEHSNIKVLKDVSVPKRLKDLEGRKSKEDYYKSLARPGQTKFRKDVLKTYGSQCAITGCKIEHALEAAHIVSWAAAKDDSVENGIPLRRDVHRLFDLGLISINSNNLSISFDPTLKDYFGREPRPSKLIFINEIKPKQKKRLKAKFAQRAASTS